MGFHERSQSGLIKQQLAELLREEILHGRLAPGEPIVEIRWARRFGVGQASIREAINILVGEGFVEKLHGRSAQVTDFSVLDMTQIQVLRAALEGLAVKLVTERKVDLADLEQAYSDMAAAAERGNMRALIERDLHFHLLILEKSGNRFLIEAGRRTLVPLFAFTMLRVISSGVGPDSFLEGMKDHAGILELIRQGDPEKAQEGVSKALHRFAQLGREVWMKSAANVQA